MIQSIIGAMKTKGMKGKLSTAFLNNPGTLISAESIIFTLFRLKALVFILDSEGEENLPRLESEMDAKHSSAKSP